MVSAEAVEWYYNKGSACGNGAFTLVCKHLGSVIACAFMNAFFGIADFIFDSLIPTCDDGKGGLFYCCNRFAGFFDLARSDSLSLVYLSGNAYCNSARYSEYLSVNSSISRKFNSSAESQSASRIYRIAAHFALGGIVTLVAFWIFGYTFKHEVAIPAMLILLFISMGVATFFISLHADAGEAILVLYLMDQEFSQRRGTAKPTDKTTEIEKDLNNYFDTHPSNDKSKLWREKKWKWISKKWFRRIYDFKFKYTSFECLIFFILFHINYFTEFGHIQIIDEEWGSRG